MGVLWERLEVPLGILALGKHKPVMVEPIAKQQNPVSTVQEQKFFVRYDEESFCGNRLIESYLQHNVLAKAPVSGC